MQNQIQEITCRITGRVQMVMFRDFTCRKARRLGLVGTVQNRKDGSVEVHAQGNEQMLKMLIAALHKGSVFASVDTVEVHWQEPTRSYEGFTIVY